MWVTRDQPAQPHVCTGHPMPQHHMCVPGTLLCNSQPGVSLRRPALLAPRSHGFEELLQVRGRRRREQRRELRPGPSIRPGPCIQGLKLIVLPCSTLNSVSEGPVPPISSKSRVFLLKDCDPVGLSASRSVGFSIWTVLIGRTVFNTMLTVPDPTLSISRVCHNPPKSSQLINQR